MVTITQFVYVKEGKEEIFQQFESLVLPLIPQYNGKLLLRLRTSPEQLIDGLYGRPDPRTISLFERRLRAESNDRETIVTRLRVPAECTMVPHLKPV